MLSQKICQRCIKMNKANGAIKYTLEHELQLVDFEWHREGKFYCYYLKEIVVVKERPLEKCLYALEHIVSKRN